MQYLFEIGTAPNFLVLVAMTHKDILFYKMLVKVKAQNMTFCVSHALGCSPLNAAAPATPAVFWVELF